MSLTVTLQCSRGCSPARRYPLPRQHARTLGAVLVGTVTCRHGWLQARLAVATASCAPREVLLQAELRAPGVVEVGESGAAGPGGLVMLGGEGGRAGTREERLAAGTSVGRVLRTVRRGRDVHDVAPSLLAADRAHRVNQVGMPPHCIPWLHRRNPRQCLQQD